MGDRGASGASDLDLEDLLDEYSSLPPQIAEWLWCVEYVAKFYKDLNCVLELMNIGLQYPNDYGKRINEVLSLRVLEFMFDPSKNDSTSVAVASSSDPKFEFDLSLSSGDVLRAILKEIPVPELRAGMPELSKFNVLPFIAHKNTCLPQCALEKLRDVTLMENQTIATPSMETSDPVLRGGRSMDTCEEEPIDVQQVHAGLEHNRNMKDQVIVIDDEDEPMHTNEKDAVIVSDDDTNSDQDTTGEPINNANCSVETFSSSSRRCLEDVRVKCMKDGTWLISGSDDESDMVKDSAMTKQNPNTYMKLLPLSSRTRPQNVCWKCKKEGTLLICSRNECATKVHKECMNCPINFDEDGNFHCPMCWYDRVVKEYHETQKLIRCAKRKLVRFLPILSTRSKRHKC